MFCPKCKYEYIRGVFDCPDCGEKLVETLPVEAEEPFSDESKTVEIFQTSEKSILAMVKAILEDNGIISIISPPIGMRASAIVYQVFVNELDAEKARDLLDGIEESQAESLE